MGPLSIKLGDKIITGDYQVGCLIKKEFVSQGGPFDINISSKNIQLTFDEFFQYKNEDDQDPIYDKDTGEII